MQIKCHEGLAISFGSEEQLTEWQKTIDKNLKVASALAIKAIRKLPDGQKDWNSILVTLSRIATLVPAGDPVQRNEIISHERKAGWDFKSKVDEVLKMKVCSHPCYNPVPTPIISLISRTKGEIGLECKILLTSELEHSTG